jgi:hypothetical protein
MKGRSKRSDEKANPAFAWSEIVREGFKLHPRSRRAYKLSTVGLTIFVVVIFLNLSYFFSGKEVRRHSEFPPGSWY